MKTMETLRLVRQHEPEMLLCVASNGLKVGPFIRQMAKLQVSHVTITVNAVDPDIGSKVYAWMRDGARAPGREAAAELLQRQFMLFAI